MVTSVSMVSRAYGNSTVGQVTANARRMHRLVHPPNPEDPRLLQLHDEYTTLSFDRCLQRQREHGLEAFVVERAGARLDVDLEPAASSLSRTRPAPGEIRTTGRGGRSARFPGAAPTAQNSPYQSSFPWPAEGRRMCGERTFRISIPAPRTHKKNPFPMREGVLGDRLPTFPGVRWDVRRPQLNLTRIPRIDAD